MCLIAAAVFLGLAMTAAGKGEWLLMLLHGTIAAAFILLMIRNIKKTREERKNKQDEKR
jgi:hypothetical protein